MWVLLWLPRITLGRLFRPVNRYFDTLAADAEFLIEQWRRANPK
jgi:hypothetical protein